MSFLQNDVAGAGVERGLPAQMMMLIKALTEAFLHNVAGAGDK